jgi:hypothetical protein
MISWRKLDKINVHIQYVTYNSSMAIGPHVCDSWHITKQKKTKKNVMYSY